MRFLFLFLFSFNAYSITCEEAKAIIAEITTKEVKTTQDMARLRNAVNKISACIGNL